MSKYQYEVPIDNNNNIIITVYVDVRPHAIQIVLAGGILCYIIILYMNIRVYVTTCHSYDDGLLILAGGHILRVPTASYNASTMTLYFEQRSYYRSKIRVQCVVYNRKWYELWYNNINYSTICDCNHLVEKWAIIVSIMYLHLIYETVMQIGGISIFSEWYSNRYPSPYHIYYYTIISLRVTFILLAN